MTRQLHAGQLRYHDFTLLREARALREKRRNANLNVNVHSNYNIFPMSKHEYHSLSGLLRNSSNSLILHPSTLQQSRTLFSASSFASKLHEMKLKALERVANADPSNIYPQYEFLLALSEKYPEAVIQRFEMYTDTVVDERCAVLYLNALSALGKSNHLNVGNLVSRLNHSGNVGLVDMSKLKALEELKDNSVKDGKKVSKAELAREAIMILSGGMGSLGVGVGVGAGVGLAGGRQYGSNPKLPLFVQIAQKTSFRDQLFRAAYWGVGIFVLISAVGAILDERGVGRTLGMGGKHVQEAEGSDVRFDDVKGVEEAKAELEEIVLYLKDPDRFTRLGGKLPRGLLLTGPPGTGKTMLAKAIAGEADVPFFFSSGSQFEEVYVGLGAKRIRELFEQAKKKAPAIIFIDEIDAVGGSRKLKDQSALKMTLNELLVQMDGFEENNGIIVVGATNFMESLDQALLRPGRFDKHVVVPLPDVGGRKDILEMYAKKTKLGKDVDLDVLARGTTGFSGADLHNLMNQAALKASVDGLNAISMAVFEYAKDKIIMGAERKTAVITAKTARNTAYHEAGHAVVACLTDGAQPIHKATIMPRGSSLGMVTMLPEGDQTSMSYKEMLAQMDVCMGGRVAEELIFGHDDVTSGAMSDIQQATRIARAMVTKYGFSNEVGVVYHEGETGDQSASTETRATIDAEVKKLSDQAYARAKGLLTKYKKQHLLLAETLLEYETLTGDEVRELITKGRKPSRPVVNKDGGAKGDQSIFRDGKNNRNKPSRGPIGTRHGVGDKVGARRDHNQV